MGLAFDKFAEAGFDALALSDAESLLFAKLRHAAGKYSDLAALIEKDVELSDHLLRSTNDALGSKLKEPVSSVSVALSLLGFEQARDFMAASIVSRDKGLQPGSPRVGELVRFARLGAQAADPGTDEREATGGGEWYAGGLVFDTLLKRLSGEEPDPKVAEFALKSWEHALKAARLSEKLARALYPEKGVEKDVILDALLHDCGKLVLGLSAGEAYLANAGCAHSLEKGRHWEEQTFGLSHDAVGHLALWRLGFAPESAWIALYHHQPFLAVRAGATTRLRCTLVWLADQILRRDIRPDDAKNEKGKLAALHAAVRQALGRLSPEAFREAVGKTIT